MKKLWLTLSVLVCFLLVACDRDIPATTAKAESQEKVLPPIVPENETNPLHPGSDQTVEIYNKEKKLSSKIMESLARMNDYTPEEIEKIKLTFYLEKGPMPAGEKKIDLKNNLLFIDGVVFSGIVTMAVEETTLFVDGYQFTPINGPVIPTSLAHNEFMRNKIMGGPECAQYRFPEYKNKKRDSGIKVIFNKSISDKEKEKEIKTLMEQLEYENVKVFVGQTSVQMFLEKKPCLPNISITIFPNEKKREIPKVDPQVKEMAERAHRNKLLNGYVSQLKEGLARSAEEHMISIFSSGFAECRLEEGREFLKLLTAIVNKYEWSDKNMLLELNLNWNQCVPMDLRPFVFANPNLFLATTQKALSETGRR